MVNARTLQRYSLFGGLMEEQIEKIIPLMEQETYGPNVDIIVEGKPNDKIRFITEGRVAIWKGDTFIWELPEGNVFGEMEVLDVMPSAATVRSVTTVTAFSISNKSLREIYRNDIKSFSLLIMNLARDLSRRLRAADEKMAEKPEQRTKSNEQ
ncbi:MAG: cyclic nucleotide-binding domain-containing protein [Treponema sp.]|jgi:CRP-like cAMP-binding protein|nr:cyclic nucleotide-binding domain-containing protein [Treponema sp.]